MSTDDVTGENPEKHNSNWQIPDHSYRILIIGSSGLGKTITLFDLMNHQPDIDNIYLYPKDPYEVKYQSLIYKCKSVDLKHWDGPKAFIEYSNDVDDIYENIDESNPNEKRKKKKQKKILFDNMMACLYACKK